MLTKVRNMTEVVEAMCGAMKCGGCGERGTVRRQNTAYHDEICNWTIACDSCFQEIQGYWEERWADYYGGIL